jgi:hypothetical protein
MNTATRPTIGAPDPSYRQGDALYLVSSLHTETYRVDGQVVTDERVLTLGCWQITSARRTAERAVVAGHRDVIIVNRRTGAEVH